MDSLTHLVAGACIGEILVGKSLGKRAMLLGGIAQSIPDIDFVASFWMTTWDYLLAHRGFTHSFLFLLLIVPILAWLARRWIPRQNLSLKTWILFFSVQILFHLFLDSMNSYGTAWFLPFGHKRIAYNILFVADPLLTIWPLVASVTLMIIKVGATKRKLYAKIALVISLSYLLIAALNKAMIEDDIKMSLKAQSIEPVKHFSSPTPFNSFLWYVVAEVDSGFYVGYSSNFDRIKTIKFTYFPRNEALLGAWKNTEMVTRLKTFAQGFYTVEKWGDTLVFNDLRFGQTMGWTDPKARFVFNYYLKGQDENVMVVQRGRFKNWNRRTLKELLERIGGN